MLLKMHIYTFLSKNRAFSIYDARLCRATMSQAPPSPAAYILRRGVCCKNGVTFHRWCTCWSHAAPGAFHAGVAQRENKGAAAAAGALQTQARLPGGRKRGGRG